MKILAQRILSSNALTRHWLHSRRQRQRERDWSTTHSARFGKTEIHFQTNIGLGDVMIARQMCSEFTTYCEQNGDPSLGSIVISAGAWPLEFRLRNGDHNLYWWWSMNGQDDWLERYLESANVKPDAVACLSCWCRQRAEAAGCTALYLPLAVGESFQPLRLSRSGIGFAGSKGHKDQEQVAAILGPFLDRPDFEWATNIKGPGKLSEFYNAKRIVLGMTERFQEKAGMVNNRVFEVLATGTPFILHRHRAVNEVLGEDYPYQSATPGETRSLAETILADYPKHLELFERYQTIVNSFHRYKHRLSTLLEFLKHRA